MAFAAAAGLGAAGAPAPITGTETADTNVRMVRARHRRRETIISLRTSKKNQPDPGAGKTARTANAAGLFRRLRTVTRPPRGVKERFFRLFQVKKNPSVRSEEGHFCLKGPLPAPIIRRSAYSDHPLTR